MLAESIRTSLNFEPEDISKALAGLVLLLASFFSINLIADILLAPGQVFGNHPFSYNW